MIQSNFGVEATKIGGLERVRLSGPMISAEVLPSLGGKIWEISGGSSSRQWIWHRPDGELKAPAAGSAYDDVWIGGWEELFPNDAPCVFEGRTLPDHGEWWSRSWDWRPVDHGIEMTLRCESLRARCTKTVRLDANRPRILVDYRIINEEAAPLGFLFKQHLAVALREDDVIELPGGRAEPVDVSFSTRLGSGAPFTWPLGRDAAGREVDLSRPASASRAHREFVYVSDLPQGWCGIRGADGHGLRLRFDRAVFPHTWLFMTFGGWRGLYTAVLEPCTNRPKDLGAAAAAGQCATLAPGAALNCQVALELS